MLTPESIRLERRTIVVAGAGGGGIGTAVAAMAARAGARVIAIDRAEKGRGEAQAALDDAGGENHRVVDCDLFDKAAVDALFADLGPVDGLVNVVGGIQGMGNFAPLLDDEAQAIFQRVVDFNLRAAFNTSTAAARGMIAAGKGGSIVQIASSTGLTSMPYGAGYAAGKAALLNLMKTMAIEWGSAGVRVNAVAVGMIRTAMSHAVVAETDDAARQVVPMGRVGRSDEIAGPVLFLLSDLAGYVTGATLSVDGGAMARAPYNGADNLPVFVNDPTLKARLGL